jgi:hypothetical protein
MIKREQSLAELNKEAWLALVKELGFIKAARFLRQFDKGSGNYATDRDKWEEGLTIDDMLRELERSKRRGHVKKAATHGRSQRSKKTRKR